jgi:hypothetical protein
VATLEAEGELVGVEVELMGLDQALVGPEQPALPALSQDRVAPARQVYAVPS